MIELFKIYGRNIDLFKFKTILPEDLPHNKSKHDCAYELSCNKIANEAVKKLTADNVTVLIVSISNS